MAKKTHTPKSSRNREGVNFTTEKPVISSVDAYHDYLYQEWLKRFRDDRFKDWIHRQDEVLQGDRRREENKDRFLLRSGLRANIVLRHRTKSGRPYSLARSRLGFQFPNHTMVCQRRKARRRVLFALSARRLARGAGGGKNQRRILGALSRVRHLWNEASHYAC